MRWCRIRLVLLGLLLCVVHVVSGTCGQTFTDPASSALNADVVIEGKVRKTFNPEESYNITVAVKKNIFKGAKLINKNRQAKTITIDLFKNGPTGNESCIGNVQQGRTYFFFLRDIADKKGLHFQINSLPVKKNKKIANEIKKILCDGCAKNATIKNLTGPENVNETMGVKLTCQANGNPLPLISWYKDDVLLDKSRERVKIKSSKRQSTLEIKKSVRTDAGVYTCEASNFLGKSSKSATINVHVPHLGVPCELQTLCLNGGTCMHIAGLEEIYCKCRVPFDGNRCEKQQANPVLIDEDVGQASLMFERTLIIIGIVIAVLVFIAICIVSYILAKKGRKRHSGNKAKPTNNTKQDGCIKDRNIPQTETNKEVHLKNDNKASHSALMQPQQIMPQATSHPASQPFLQGNLSHFPHQFMQAEININPNGNRSEPRGRLAASSVYENVKHVEPSQYTDSGDVQKIKGTTAASISENIEMNVLPQDEKTDNKDDNPDSDCTRGNLTNGFDPKDLLLSKPSHPPSSLSLSSQTHFRESSPLHFGTSITPSEQSAQSSISPSQIPPQRFNGNVFTLHENDTAVQPLLSNHKKHLPKHPYVHTQHPVESKSDKDLSRYLPLSNKRQGTYDVNGYDIQENNHLLRDLSKLSHSNTFPKSKMNGLSSDVISDSDEEDASEVPYEKQLDLYISEEDLDLSKENLVSSSFSSVNAPSRQTSLEERGFKLRSNSGLSRPGIRKHQSEESSAYNKFANRSYAFLQDNARSHSLDNPPGRVDVKSDPHQLNSTVVGSPDVETYDNIMPPQLQNHSYIYDPNDDSAPWDADISRTGNRLTEEQRDKLNRLKDVVPDQQAIPI